MNNNNYSTQFPEGKWQPGEPEYSYVIKKDVGIKMSDGKLLYADVAYPADKGNGQIAKGKFPVVIEMTPYVTLGAPVNVMTYFSEHGYISVVIRLRGTGKSEGEVDLYADRDAGDSRNVIDWAANMEGSDGRVAFVGCSFPAGMALLAASSCGKKSPLKAVVACNNALESVYRECWLCGGTPTAGFANYSNAGRILYGNSPATNRFFDRMSKNIMSGGDIAYDGEFWSKRLPMEYANKIVENDVPVLLWTGFYDILDIPAYKTYTALQNAYANRPVFAPMEKGQKVSPKFQLVAGGWHHAEDLNLGIYLEWIETWLKGTDTGLQDTDKPLHLYEGGSKRWYNESAYPMNDGTEYLYLANDNTLTEQNTESSTDTLVFGWPDDRKSFLTYSTKALDKDFILSGPISLNLSASSSNTNLEIIANLYDVDEKGEKTWISRGIIIGSLRKPSEEKSWRDSNGNIIWNWQELKKDEYLEPGKTYEFDIPLAPRQWCVRKGHRLSLELSCQTPKDLVPPRGQGLPKTNNSLPGYLTEPQEKTIEGGTYTIRLGGNNASVLILPKVGHHLNYVPSAIVPDGWDETFRRMSPNHDPLPLNWKD